MRRSREARRRAAAHRGAGAAIPPEPVSHRPRLGPATGGGGCGEPDLVPQAPRHTTASTLPKAWDACKRTEAALP